MRFFTPQPVPTETVERLRSLKDAGTERERLIGEMRGAGLHIVECIKLVRDLFGIDLGEAKRIVHASDAWTDVSEPVERLHEDLLQAAEADGWTVNHEAAQENRVPTAA